MIRSIITPLNTDVHISIPQSYVGKKIEVLLFASDEPEQERVLESKPTASFRGALKLTDEEYKDFQDFMKQGREE